MRVSDVLQKPLVRGIITFITGLAAIIWVVSVYGCASVTVNPETKDITYTRIGNQNLDVHVKTPEGYEIDMKQNSKSEMANTLIKEAVQLLAR